MCKGDASLCYLREEAVELAITLLDGVELRPGYDGLGAECRLGSARALQG